MKHNFFGEYHGKNIVDGHFGKLSRWKKEFELYRRIDSIDNLITLYKTKEVLRTRSNDSNNNGKKYFLKFNLIERNLTSHSQVGKELQLVRGGLGFETQAWHKIDSFLQVLWFCL